jgi:guanidinoacetate N-methyltransferase
LDEFADDIHNLDAISRRFVTGEGRKEFPGEWETSPVHIDTSQLIIGGQEVMQDWQRPLMKAMSDIVSESHGDVLEIGFGMGISASYIQERGVRSHSIVECNDGVIRSFERWREALQEKKVTLIRGRWQDVVAELGVYDGILFDTYPTSQEEFDEYVVEHVTFAEPFFETAALCLKKGGVFTYYTNEADSFSRRHQRLLFKHFSSICLSVVKSLSPPKNNINWWVDSMVVVRAVK